MIFIIKKKFLENILGIEYSRFLLEIPVPKGFRVAINKNLFGFTVLFQADFERDGSRHSQTEIVSEKTVEIQQI